MNLFSLFRRKQKTPATPIENSDAGRSIIGSTNVKVFMKLEDQAQETEDDFEVSPYRVVSKDR